MGGNVVSPHEGREAKRGTPVHYPRKGARGRKHRFPPRLSPSDEGLR
jgi:hypothetical protein